MIKLYSFNMSVKSNLGFVISILIMLNNISISLEDIGDRAKEECRKSGLRKIECKRLLDGSKERVPADLLDFPHMALIGFQQTDESEVSWSCGGSLISSLWILSAAHCLNDPRMGRPKKVLLGTTTFENEEPEDIIQMRHLIELVKHPDYMPPAKYNDIALMKMDEAIDLTGAISIACLDADDIIFNKAVASGFGKTSFDSATGSLTMMHVELDIISPERCNSSLRSMIRHGMFLKHGILPSQICAGDIDNGGKDTCQGDSGGPLQLLPKEQDCKKTFPLYALVGVTSFGRFCGFKNSPGVYSRVSHFIEWIESIVWPHENNIDFYY